MSISNIIVNRKISEILHFTTNRGLSGIFYTNELKARSLLAEDERLEYIFEYNTNNQQRARDSSWHDFINLSISEINYSFFKYSNRSLENNDSFFWCILSFSPEILVHEGVYFATTNNTYTDVSRGVGAEGLESLFANKVIRWWSNIEHRTENKELYLTTCNQAEVLYPQSLSLDYLLRVYVRNDCDYDEVQSILAVTGCSVSVEVCPEKFEVKIDDE